MRIFKRGQEYTNTDWFTGGQMHYIVKSRSENKVVFTRNSHELDGDHEGTEEFTINTDANGNESVLIYEYHGHENRLHAEEVTREQAYSEYYKLATKPVGDGKPDLDSLREATLVYEKLRKMLVIHGNPVRMEVSKYSNDRLYVGLIDLMEDDIFADVTINLPDLVLENPYDAYLSNDIRDIAEWLEEIGAGKSTGESATYNMGQYSIFHFYPGRLKELDPNGYMMFEGGNKQCIR